jgi:hypothetical protein
MQNCCSTSGYCKSSSCHANELGDLEILVGFSHLLISTGNIYRVGPAKWVADGRLYDA